MRVLENDEVEGSDAHISTSSARTSQGRSTYNPNYSNKYKPNNLNDPYNFDSLTTPAPPTHPTPQTVPTTPTILTTSITHTISAISTIPELHFINFIHEDQVMTLIILTTLIP